MFRRFTLLLALVLTLCTGLLGSPGPVAAEESDPFLTRELFPPREVLVPGAATTTPVVLLDALGGAIPLTGPGQEVRGADLVVFPPRLPAGQYRVRHASGEFDFEVGTPPFTVATPSEGVDGIPWWPVLLLTAALPGAFLLLRPSRRLLAVPLFGIAGVGALLLFSGDTTTSPAGKADPCVAAGATLVDCATEHVLAVFEQGGVDAASTELLRLSSTPGSAWAPVCHEIAHDLGSLAFRVSRNPVTAIEGGFLDCSLGYVHGALEAMGTYLPDTDLPTALTAACRRLDELFLPAGTQSILGCHHGAGHAAMWRFNENLSAAREVCDDFTMDRQREECKVGALMEWVYADQRATASGRPADAPVPRVASTLDLCAPPHGELTAGCVEGALTAVDREDVPLASQWCEDQPSILAACVTSLARRVVQMDLSERGSLLEDPMSFCGEFASDDVRAQCAQRLGYMHLFLSRSTSAAAELCTRFPASFIASCRDGNREVREYAESLGDGSFNFRD